MSVESLEFWKNLFEIAGVVLLLLTFIAGAGALWFNRKLNAVQSEQVRQFNLELGRQKERTAKAEQAASDAALALAKFKQWRVLSQTQQAEIAAKVKPFFSTFDVAASNTSEPLTLVTQIEDSLSAAGWKQLDWPAMNSNSQAYSVISRPGRAALGIAIEHGVTVQVEQSDKEELLGIAKMLAAALSAEGIDAEAQFMAIKPTNKHAIHIVVGEKPQQ
jgi:hypothetical protein